MASPSDTKQRERVGRREAGAGVGTLAGAALAGAAVGIAASAGRRLFVQFSSAAAGDWFEMLKAEHRAALALFDRIEETADDQVTARAHLLSKLKKALDKHAFEEENTIYPALREANLAHDADALNAEHFYVKTYLYELGNAPAGTPDWLARVKDFHAIVEEHVRMEEDEVFPAFRRLLSEDENDRLTAAMNKEGLRMV